MGMTGGAQTARRLLRMSERMVAIELMCAAQGLECRLPLKPGIEVGQAYEAVRRVVAPLDQDRVLAGDIEKLAEAVRGEEFARF